MERLLTSPRTLNRELFPQPFGPHTRTLAPDLTYIRGHTNNNMLKYNIEEKHLQAYMPRSPLQHKPNQNSSWFILIINWLNPSWPVWLRCSSERFELYLKCEVSDQDVSIRCCQWCMVKSAIKKKVALNVSTWNENKKQTNNDEVYLSANKRPTLWCYLCW